MSMPSTYLAHMNPKMPYNQGALLMRPAKVPCCV